MGIFDFLKSRGIETVNFTEIEAWLDKQVESKQLHHKVARTKNAIFNKIIEGHRLLAELEKAGLRNENIPLKAKQIMEGHRKAYIQKLKKFLDEIEVPEDFSQIGYYAASFSESLDQLSQDTHKNYAVLKEFLEEELTRVVRAVKSIEDELAKLQAEIEKEGIELIKDAKVRFKQYHNDLKRKAVLEEERKRHEDDYENLKERKHKLESKLHELRQSQEYQAYKEFIDNKKQYEEQLRNIEAELKIMFAELNRPLRKYKHLSPQEKLLDKYLLDPLGALQDDDSFVMLEVLGRMSQELHNLELKENQLEKAMELINKLSRDFFLNKKLEIDRLKGLNREMASKINTSVMALNIAEAETLVRGVNEKIIHADQSLEELKKAFEEINLDYLKQKVKEKIKEISPKIIINDW